MLEIFCSIIFLKIVGLEIFSIHINRTLNLIFIKKNPSKIARKFEQIFLLYYNTFFEIAFYRYK